MYKDSLKSIRTCNIARNCDPLCKLCNKVQSLNRQTNELTQNPTNQQSDAKLTFQYLFYHIYIYVKIIPHSKSKNVYKSKCL